MDETILQRAGRWIAGLRLDDLPGRVIDKIRLQIATSVSAAAAAPWHEPALRVLAAHRSDGPALVFATGDRLRPDDAAFVNAAFSMSLDFDDYQLTGHTGHSAVQVPLAHAAALGAGLDEVVVAAAAANELMGRLSSASLLGPLNGQMSSYIHNLGAAISLGKLLGLDAAQLTAAMGLALYQPSFCLGAGFWNEHAKTITASLPLQQGMEAARLAAAGLEGPDDLLEHPLGFSAFFSFGRFPGIFEGLGAVWFSDTLSSKRFPGTSYISAAVEATLDACGSRPIAPGALRSLRVETTILSATLDNLGGAALARSPLDANAVNFSLRLSVAAALHFGGLAPDHLRPERLAAAERSIRALADRVVVVHDWAQTLRMLGASPLGAALLRGLGVSGAVRLAWHLRRLGAASTGPKAGRRIAPIELAAALRPLLRRGPKPSARALCPETFPMRQSARVILQAGAGRPEVRTVEIPAGACGRDLEEAQAVVRARCEAVFGDRAHAVLAAIMQAGGTIEALYTAAG